MMLFSVALLFHTTSVNEPETHLLWEERIVLIVADSPEEAFSKAEATARKLDREYENAEGQMVAVRLSYVEHVFPLWGEISDGCELFSRFLNDSTVKSLLEPRAD